MLSNLSKINFCNGTIYLTNDIKLVMMEANNPSSKILYIDDSIIEPLENHPNVILAGILLPSYDSICALEDNNDIDNAFRIYECTLNNYFPKIIYSMLVSMAFYGTHLLIYMPPHISTIVGYIEEYMMKNYGIIVGTSSHPFGYDYAFNDLNVGNLYTAGLIDYINALYSFTPMGFVQNLQVMKKLIIDIEPVIKGNEWNDYVNYFAEYQNILHTSGLPLRSPICSIS